MLLKIYTAEEKAHRRWLIHRVLLFAFLFPLANLVLLTIPGEMLLFYGLSRELSLLITLADLMTIVSGFVSIGLTIASLAFLGSAFLKYTQQGKYRTFFMVFALVGSAPLVHSTLQLISTYILTVNHLIEGTILALQQHITRHVLIIILDSILMWGLCVVFVILCALMCYSEKEKLTDKLPKRSGKKRAVASQSLPASRLFLPFVWLVCIWAAIIFVQELFHIIDLASFFSSRAVQLTVWEFIVNYILPFVYLAAEIMIMIITSKVVLKWIDKKEKA